jgi:AraC-like DNA-binding protein
MQKTAKLPEDLKSRYLLPGAKWNYRAGDKGAVFSEQLSVLEYAVCLHYTHILSPVMVQVKSNRTINGLYYQVKGSMLWNPSTDNLLIEETNYQWYYLKKQKPYTVWLEPGIHLLFHFSVPVKTTQTMAQTYFFVQELRQQTITVVVPLLNMSRDISGWITRILDCREEQKIGRDICISERLTALHKEYMKDVEAKQRQLQWEQRHQFSMGELDRYLELNMVLDPDLHPFNLHKIAAWFGLVSAQLSQLYHQYQSEPLDDYIHAYRMKRAMQMVEENKLSITEIAVKTGYSNLSSFSNVFTKFYENSPAFYRKKNNGQGDPSTSS